MSAHFITEFDWAFSSVPLSTHAEFKAWDALAVVDLEGFQVADLESRGCFSLTELPASQDWIEEQKKNVASYKNLNTQTEQSDQDSL